MFKLDKGGLQVDLAKPAIDQKATDCVVDFQR